MTKKSRSRVSSRWLYGLSALIVVGWLAVSGIGGPYFGKISKVSSNDLTNFLPKSAEATAVNTELLKFRDSSTIPLIAVFHDPTRDISDSDMVKLTDSTKQLRSVEGVSSDISPPIRSDDGKAAIIVIPLASGAEFKTIFPALKSTIDGAGIGISYKLAGPASFARDLQNAFGGIDVTLLLVALAVVFVILLIVYRSPLLPVIVLLGSISALSAAIIIVYHLAANGAIQLNGQVQGILSILVIGAATDYSLLYIARLREELSEHRTTWEATKAALKGSWEPIVAAGGTVIVGLLFLLLSDLGSNKALGPVGSIGIILAIISSLTFLPAALLLAGRTAFWPRKPQYDLTHNDKYEQRHRLWASVGAFVRKYPRRVWIVTSALLIVACAGYFQLKADGVAQSDFVLGKSEARDAQAILNDHFPGGSGSPTYVIVPESKVDQSVTVIDADPGVASTAITATGSPSGTAPIGKSKQKLLETLQAAIAKRGQIPAGTPVESFSPFKNATPKVIDGMVLLQVTLTDGADTQAARATIVRLRTALHPLENSIKVGGISAVQYDTIISSERDRYVIIPLILAAITVILVVLLRSLVAPIILLLTTVVSFEATLGVSAVLFNHVFQFPGADPSVVLFGFVFLVALGIDYNIFLMTRVREEINKRGVVDGTIKALVVTGGVITSAGVVLASTFAALGVIPILFLAQLAFIVAFGVLLDTIIVRSLLVPSLTIDIGRPMWWPSKLARQRKGE